ncbi:MAG: D-alanyl-D-alanine carboxypeptidase/D-alanyl-D-alanine-endopeptidase [Ignavibacteriaceae bacterium]
MKLRLFLFVLFTQAILFSQITVKESLNKLVSEPFFDTTVIAIDIFNLTKGEPLFRKHSSLLMRPASNMKVLTTAAALIYLGSDYKFSTGLYYEGRIEKSELKGNLFIKGACDPDFTTDDIKEFADALKNAGIKKIKGNLFADVSMKDSLFWGSGWMWDDDPSTDAPYLSALNINDNCITIIVEIDEGGEVKITSEPKTEYIKITNYLRVSKEPKQRITITRDFLNRTNEILIKGDYEQGKKRKITTTLNIFNPTLYFLNLVKERFREEGISITGKIDTLSITEKAINIGEVNREFGEVIINLNKTSDNLSAEMTLLALGEKYFGKPTSAGKGIKMIDSLIMKCGFVPENYRIEDGSGVSHYTLVSAELLSGILKYLYYSQPELQAILENSLPNAGVDGSLKNRMRGTLAENNVRAKTGTLSGVSCLSGYVTGKNGDKYAFSIMIQNHVYKTNRAVDYQNKICEILANY